MKSHFETRRALLRALAGAACVAGAGCAPGPGMGFVRPSNAPYGATPMDVVTEMLKLANVQTWDKVFDLGCGDGRIVMAAARWYGASGVCVDTDRYLIYEGRENARISHIYEKVLFLNQDLFDTDLGDATVVMLALTREMNLALRPKLERELRPGSRVVSYIYDMGDWAPREVVRVTSGGVERPIYLWQIPSRRESIVAAVGGGGMR
jgi:SAM-dependent methyltransferase